MNIRCRRVLCALLASSALSVQPTNADAGATKLAAAQAAQPHEASANTLTVPTQILKSGINLNSTQLSPNTLQLANMLKLTPVLERVDALRSRVSNTDSTPTLESLATRQSLLEALQEATQIIQEADLAVDFTIAEINAEQGVYSELLSTYQAQANKLVFQTNAISYVSNGALWAVAEALAIPSWKRPKYAISSGINGIIAGVIPSIASLYAMKASSGRRHPAEHDPNMLAKVFNMPTEPEIEYPTIIWSFLNSVPPGDASGKTRKDQLVDRWVGDKNIPSFTDRNARSQIEVLTASTTRKRAVTIELLQTRQTMLGQLSAELLKMKRMLYELALAAHGEKHV